MVSRVQSEATPAVVRRSLQGRRLSFGEIAFQGALLLALLISLLILLVLLGDVLQTGLPLLMERGTNFLNSGISSFSASTAGVYQGLVGSLMTIVIVIFVAIPLGVAAAVYLEEYAKDTRLNRFINVNIRNLAGVPSIVYGLLGLALFVELLRGVTGGASMIAAGLTLAVLVLPIVIITSAEALRAVPQSIREGAYGVGATHWQVIRYHVLPPAMPGVMTGTVLSLARALGETAPVLLVGAVTGFLASGNLSMFELLREPRAYTTLPTVIFQYSTLPNAAFREVAAASIIVLLAVILTANAAAIILRNRYERKW